MKNLFQWKTTVLGLALVVAAGYAYFSPNYDDSVFVYGAFFLGVAFLFFPDNIIGVIRRFLSRKSKQL